MSALARCALLAACALAACGPREAAVAPQAPKQAPPPVVASFEACVAAGNPVMESYPRQCRTRDGRSFTEDVGNRVDKQGLIQVDEPTPNQLIASPLTIHGKARGMWFFEASFPVSLLGPDGATLATVPAQADGEWMTEDFVPFHVTLSFTAPAAGGVGRLVLRKSNASGMPEHDDQLVIPVRLGPG
ncbi:MAG TPA: Gmad2 immunoglobulin-like domain-containing protein [Solimonas sp.]|nr:Gmad2 immunoglobulin-like domain-containing protein [Solimonas sp.]